MDNRIYHALSQARYSFITEPDTECLTDAVEVPIAAYQPLFPANLTRAPDPLPVNSYVKRPRLISHDRLRSSRPTHIAEQVLREAEVCEILKRNPHPNIAKYLGCEVHNGLITGICFVRYQETLMQRVNPRGYMKRAFRYDSETFKDRDSILDNIETGIRHLHSLGLVHNDINPSNIMLDGNTPIIIDFNSCRPTGESLEWIGRTYEWYDEEVQSSTPSNDLNALDEIREWLTDKDTKNIKFKE